MSEIHDREKALAILASFRAANEDVRDSKHPEYRGNQRDLTAVEGLTLEAIFHLADDLASSPEEWTELTGIKLGAQRQ